MRHIREVEVDGGQYDVESDDKGVTFRKRGSELPFLSIVWQDVYSAAWQFAQIRTEYDSKTGGVRVRANREGEDEMAKQLKLTDFERDVTISVLETALGGWDGDEARMNAAQRAVDKLRGLDEAATES